MRQDIDTILTTPKWHLLMTESNLGLQKMIRTKIEIHKDENKSLYIRKRLRDYALLLK
jgi:hypothetical protein